MYNIQGSHKIWTIAILIDLSRFGDNLEFNLEQREHSDLKKAWQPWKNQVQRNKEIIGFWYRDPTYRLSWKESVKILHIGLPWWPNLYIL